MKRTPPLAIALFFTAAAAVGSMRLWWLYATRMEQRYLVDYCRFTLGVPDWSFWPYRISVAQHLPLARIPEIFDGRPLWQVLLWPLVATVLVGLAGIIFAAMHAGPSTKDELLQGAPVVSHWRWNWPLMFRRSERGFYIDTK